MPRARVLIVDDSVVVRRAVTELFARDAAFEVVGTAPNGLIALDKLPQLAPDVVVLDLEMPELDGLETLRRIRQIAPRLPVVIFSALTARGGALTLDALALGASDYVTKPAQVGDKPISVQDAAAELLRKTRALTAGLVYRAPVVARAAERSRVELLVIGASTGGPQALTAVMAPLSQSFPVPILIVQHMPPLFTRLFAERLTSESSGLVVEEARGGELLERGRGWVAPGDHHLTVGFGDRLSLNRDAPENSCRPSVDVLFRSAARARGGNVLAVLLTGMGQDGLRGCEAVREAGGQVIVQDQATSVVWSMPGSVATAGLADAVLPIDQIAPEILARVAPAAAGVG
jgi:two-component system chemotaxis response regulator CheB